MASVPRTPQTIRRRAPPAEPKAILVVEDADADGCSGGLFVGGLHVRHTALSADRRGAKRRRPRVPSVLQVDSICAPTLARSTRAFAVPHCACTGSSPSSASVASKYRLAVLRQAALGGQAELPEAPVGRATKKPESA